MKSKTKTILIFTAILAAVFLIAFLDGGAVQSAADEEEEGTLIGAFVSEEDLDIDDLEVTATARFSGSGGGSTPKNGRKAGAFRIFPMAAAFTARCGPKPRENLRAAQRRST